MVRTVCAAGANRGLQFARSNCASRTRSISTPILAAGLSNNVLRGKDKGRSGGLSRDCCLPGRSKAFFLYGFAKSEMENIGSKMSWFYFGKLAAELVCGRIARDPGARSKRAISGGRRWGRNIARLSEAILEMAGDHDRSGLMDNEEYDKITVRLFGAQGASHSQAHQRRGDPQAAGAREYEPGSFCPFSQSERGLHLSVGAWGQRAQRAGAGAAECDSAEGV